MNAPESGGIPFACIIGAPRSGSTWLQAMLGAHPLIATSTELKLFDLFTGPWEQAWQRLIDLERSAGGGPRGLRNVWSDDEFRQLLRELVGRVHRRVLVSKGGATVVLDKTPAYSSYVGHIIRMAPQVRFIHLLRDGRDVAASLRAAARTWARTWAPGTILAAAALWKAMVSAAREASRLGPERYLELRYEDLRVSGPAALVTAFDFLGVATSASDATDIWQQHTIERMRQPGGPFELPQEFFRHGRIGGWRDEFTARERYLFHYAAGDLLRDLGYAGDSWWVNHTYQRWLLPAAAAIRPREQFHALVHHLARGRRSPA